MHAHTRTHTHIRRSFSVFHSHTLHKRYSLRVCVQTQFIRA